ncbi:MAG: HPF/RaiA family ribosome-associated protein [Gammaproteobacteria bacterium]
MQTIIQALGFSLTDALENHVHNRIGFTFSHFSGRVRRVTVRLSDLNGPRGGIDKCCLVEVRLDGLPAVVVEDVQPDIYIAIDRAIGRAARSIVRRLSAKNSKRRQQAVELAHHASPGL